MNPSKVRRQDVKEFTHLPNVGPKIASTMFGMGTERPADLVGRDRFELYLTLCETGGRRYDPCVLDVFLSITGFMRGDEPKARWAYTAERKRAYPDL
jgi:hypothetical protein